MPNFDHAIRVHQNLSLAAQKQAGQAGGNDMDEKHKKFLAEIIGMLDRKEIDVSVPASVLKKQHYEKLPERQRDAVDFALLNLVDQLRHIEWFFRSKTTPNASPELQTMIEHLWNMKSRLEEKHGDVLKF